VARVPMQRATISSGLSTTGASSSRFKPTAAISTSESTINRNKNQVTVDDCHLIFNMLSLPARILHERHLALSWCGRLAGDDFRLSRLPALYKLQGNHCTGRTGIDQA